MDRSAKLCVGIHPEAAEQSMTPTIHKRTSAILRMSPRLYVYKKLLCSRSERQLSPVVSTGERNTIIF